MTVVVSQGSSVNMNFIGDVGAILSSDLKVVERVSKENRCGTFTKPQKKNT